MLVVYDINMNGIIYPESYRRARGFALPSVVVASIIMLGLLALALQLVASAGNALKEQYYNQIARQAAESGSVRAQSCLVQNNDLAQWSDTSKLKPNTSCDGTVNGSMSAYVLENDNVRTTFEVGLPVRAEGVQKVPVTGWTELLRPNGSVFRTYTYRSFSNIGASTLISSVAFGYTMTEIGCGVGAYFAVIDEFGRVKAAGMNNCGQLGNGTTVNSTALREFMLPAGKVASRVFTNFLSVGYNAFILTTDNEVWGSGYNTDGELGNKQSAWGGWLYSAVPQKYILPSSDNKAVYVTPNGVATFVVTDQGNVYAAGHNLNGSLGVGLSASTFVSEPRKVALPAGVKAQAHDDAWAADRRNTYMIADNGAVYGWGDNRSGQLAQGDANFRTTPVKIGNFGEGGNPRAKQVAFDGDTFYVVDEAGNIYSAGQNNFGQVGSRTSKLKNVETNKCLQADGIAVGTKACANVAAQSWTFMPDGSLRVSANPIDPSRMCLDNYHMDNVTLLMHACNGTAAQGFGSILYRAGPNMDGNNTRINSTRSPGLCVAETLAPSIPGQIWLTSCSGVHQQRWLPYNDTLHKVSFPGGRKAISLSTDQFFATAVMTDGKAYSWGLNNGALGYNKVVDLNNLTGYAKDIINWDPVEFELPAGKKAVYSWTTSNGHPQERANTYVITEDCEVYGAGSNVYGQLGIGTIGGGIGGMYYVPQKMLVIGDAGEGCARYVRSGYGTTVIYTSNGKVYTVGNNSNGQLGDSTTVNNPVPKANISTNVVRKLLFY